MIKTVSLEDVEKIAIDFVSRKWNAQDITVSSIEREKGTWVVKGYYTKHDKPKQFAIGIDDEGSVVSSLPL